MIVEVSYTDPKESKIFSSFKKEKLTIESLKDVECFILKNNYKFSSLLNLEGDFPTKKAKPNENLSGKLIKFENNKKFYLVEKMIIGRELEKTNSELNIKSLTPAVSVSNGTWDTISHIEVIDYDFTTNDGTALNINVMTDKEYNDLVSEYNKIQKTMSFTGHRPDKLGGYSTNTTHFIKNETMKKLRLEVQDILEYYINEKGVENFITGGALGVDQLAFWVVLDLKRKYPHIKNTLAIPFDGVEGRWRKIDKDWYYKMFKYADDVIYVENRKDYEVNEDDKRLRVIKLMQKSNEYMIDYSYYTLAVYDNTKGGTRNCLNYAKKMNREIVVIDPSKEFQEYTIDRYISK